MSFPHPHTHCLQRLFRTVACGNGRIRGSSSVAAWAGKLLWPQNRVPALPHPHAPHFAKPRVGQQNAGSVLASLSLMACATCSSLAASLTASPSARSCHPLVDKSCRPCRWSLPSGLPQPHLNLLVPHEKSQCTQKKQSGSCAASLYKL